MLIILFQAAPSALPINLIFLGLMFTVMYFFFIRPQAKKQKLQDNFVKELSKGDEVVTSSGIIGTIISMTEKTVTLQVSQKGVIEVLRSTISNELTESYKK